MKFRSYAMLIFTGPKVTKAMHLTTNNLTRWFMDTDVSRFYDMILHISHQPEYGILAQYIEQFETESLEAHQPGRYVLGNYVLLIEERT